MVKLANNSIDYTQIEFGEPKKGKDGKYFIQTTIDSQDILFQLKKLKCKSTVGSTFDAEVTQESNVELLREAEDQMLALAKDNKDKWFPDQEITDDYLDNAFMSFIKPIKKTRNVNFRMRTSSRLAVYNVAKEEVDADDVEEGKEVSCITQLSGIWFTKSRFGVVWKVFQIKMNPEKKPKEMCLFDDADDDECDEMENAFPDE
jgi:hypothetical protein